ncbi:hypothetical protein J0H58_14280 [bacterium]|nr:hypothetical protein [bacterium]
MSDGGFRGRVKLGELIDAALAPAEAVAHAGFVADLAAVTRTEDAVAAVAERLLTEGDRGRRVFLEWLARLPVRAPARVLEQVPQLLADPLLPDDLRVRAAARALRSARDPKHFLTHLVPGLTAGQTPLKALGLLRAVQGRLRRSRALDLLIARRERRLRLTCPHCPVRLPRADLARHLYEVHGLVLDRGRARHPDRIAKAWQKQYRAGRDTTLLDRAAHLSDPAALRAWAARSGPPQADLTPLAAAAGVRGCGLCPRCLGELQPSVEPLPPPLVLAGGRLTGDGYTVEVRGPDGLRTCTVSTPGGVLRSGLDGRRAVGPRAAGVVAAAAVLVAAIALRAAVPATLVLAGLACLAARFLRGPLPPAGERAVDRAWTDLVPRIRATPAGDRVLTRLCRASVGRGDEDERADVLAQLLGPATSPVRQAAVRFLQADDSSRLGVDRLAAVGSLIAAGLTGDEPIAFAEHVAGLFAGTEPPPPAPELARLRILALEAAFAAGFAPRGLADLWAACPRLKDLMAVEPLSRLGLQYAVWSLREEEPWRDYAPTETAFELARVAPTLGGRLLADYPDLLLYHRPPPGVDEALGWVLVCARGVVVGGQTVADPDAEVRVEGGRLIGSATLTFGPHRFSLPRRPPSGFVATLKRVLRVRTEVVLPHLDAALAAAPAHPGLAALARRCRCGADVLVSPGRVGRVLRTAAT